MGLFDIWKNNKKQASPQMQGIPKARCSETAHTFDFIFEQLMRFSATLYHPEDLTVDITAYERSYENHPAGAVTLRLHTAESLDWRRELLYEEDGSANKWLYELFYGEAYTPKSKIAYHFSEPDCYLFGCPEDVFRREVEKYCPHAYVDFYRRYDNGMRSIVIQFHEIPDDQVFENMEAYQRYLRTTFRL